MGPPLPWRRPRREALVLALVVAASMFPVNPTNVQDISRLALSEALVHDGTLHTEHWDGNFTADRAVHGGHTYTDKAPGMSFVAIPAVAALQLPRPTTLDREGTLQLWIVRLSTSGVALAALVFLFGRVAEGLAPGRGGVAAAALGLGTIVGPLAPTLFEHTAAAFLAFASFVLVWYGRRYALLAAGVAAGTAVVFEYQAALIALVLMSYALWAARRRAAMFMLGLVPPAIALAAYDWAAFGSPFHLSYRSVSPEFAAEQGRGVFGIGLPRLHSVVEVLAGDRGLLVATPVVAVAAIGLWYLHRRGLTAEAVVCAVVTALFLVVSTGYYLPLGGASPGPRFFAIAVPFAMLGLPPALVRWPRTSGFAIVASTIAVTAISYTWQIASPREYGGTIWGAITELLTQRQDALLFSTLALSPPVFAGVTRWVGAGIGCALAAAALLAALPARKRGGGFTAS